MKNHVLLIDVTDVTYRLWMMNGQTSRPGKDLLDNITSFIQRQRKKMRPTHTICVMDDCNGSWRQLINSDYQYHGMMLPTSFLEFNDSIISALQEQGIFKVLQEKGQESFDLIYYITEKLSTLRQNRIKIIGSDKRMLSLVNNYVEVVMPLSRNVDDRKRDKDWVIDKYGVDPEVITDYLTMVGDNSRKILGIKGIGPKRALSLLDEHDTFSEILANAPSLDGFVGKTFRSLNPKSLKEIQDQLLPDKTIGLNLSLKIFRETERDNDNQLASNSY